MTAAPPSGTEAAQTDAASEGPRALARGAAGWMLLGCTLFALMGAVGKLLGATYDSFQIAFFRSLFGFLTVLPLAMWAGLAALRTRHPLRHLSRGLIGAFGMFCGFYALTHLPLADSTAISFTTPLFLVLLAMLILGERVRWRRGTATVVGFLGVMLMVRPGAGVLDIAAAVGLLGALSAALAIVFVKQLAAIDRPVTVALWFGVVSTLAAAVPAAIVWRTPGLVDTALLILTGVLGGLGQVCTTRAYAVADATAIAPIDYSRLVTATILGYLVFAEWPDLWTLAGAAIVILSTLYIARREAALRAAGARVQGSGTRIQD